MTLLSQTSTGQGNWSWSASYNGGPYQPQCSLAVAISLWCDSTTRKWTLSVFVMLMRAYTNDCPGETWYACYYHAEVLVAMSVDAFGHLGGEFEIGAPNGIPLQPGMGSPPACCPTMYLTVSFSN